MTDYFQPTNPPRNLHDAMQYDPIGRPEIRTAPRIDTPLPVTLGSETITIVGNITVPTTVNVASSPTDPVHVHLTEVGSSGLLLDPYLPVGQSTSPWVVVGNVNAVVGGTVAVTQATTPWAVIGNVNIATINGGIEVNNDTGNPLRIIGNVNAIVTGNVVISSLPEVEIKNDAGNPISVSANASPNSVANPIYVSGAGGNINISGYPDVAVTAFEEPLAIGITPLLQATGVYGLDSDIWNQTKLNGGNITTPGDGTWHVNSGTNTGGYARLATARYVTYQPGQGLLYRWSAAFTTNGTTKDSYGVDNIVQTTGPIDREDGYAIGYSGATDNNLHRKIGILHRRNGKTEIRQLTVTVAPTGNQTATITLNGVAYTVALTASSSVSYTAEQIAAGLLTNTTLANTWNVEACGGIVTFVYYSPGAKNGTYSFSSTGTGTIAVAAFSRLIAGTTPEDTWTYVDAWNGNVPTSFDPSKLNIFSIDMRWLGAGRVRFFMEDPATGNTVLIHTQLWSSQYLVPHINKPSLRVVYRSGTTSGATPSQNVIVTGSSILGAVQGMVNQTTSSQGYFNINSTNLAKDTVWHLLSIQNPFVRNGDINKSSLVIQDLTVSCQGQDPSIIYLVKNAIGTSDLIVFDSIPNTNPAVFAQYSVSAVSETLSQDLITNVQSLGINSSATFNLMQYNLSLAPGDYISVFISSSSALTRSSAGITWRID